MVHSALTRIVVAVTALAATGAGAAHGQEVSYADSASDVFLIQADDSTTLHGDMVNTDVRWVRIDHGNRWIRAKFGFTDLARTGHGFITVLSMRTSDSRRFRVVVDAISARRGLSGLETWNGKELECPSMRHAVDYDANTVKVAMGTDCIAEPRWVQVGLFVVSTPDGNTTYVDDAQHTDVPKWSTWSRKIRRG